MQIGGGRMNGIGSDRNGCNGMQASAVFSTSSIRIGFRE